MGQVLRLKVWTCKVIGPLDASSNFHFIVPGALGFQTHSFHCQYHLFGLPTVCVTFDTVPYQSIFFVHLWKRDPNSSLPFAHRSMVMSRWYLLKDNGNLDITQAPQVMPLGRIQMVLVFLYLLCLQSQSLTHHPDPSLCLL